MKVFKPALLGKEDIVVEILSESLRDEKTSTDILECSNGRINSDELPELLAELEKKKFISSRVCIMDGYRVYRKKYWMVVENLANISEVEKELNTPEKYRGGANYIWHKTK